MECSGDGDNSKDDIEILDVIRKQYAASGENDTLQASGATQSSTDPEDEYQESSNGETCEMKPPAITRTENADDAELPKMSAKLQDHCSNEDKDSETLEIPRSAASQPGAFAEAPEGGEPPLPRSSTSLRPEQTTHVFSSPDDTDATGVPVANEVMDEEEGQSGRQDLQHAESMDDPLASNLSTRSTDAPGEDAKTPLRRPMLCLGVGLVLSVGIILLVVFLVKRSSGTDDTSYEFSVSTPTALPTTATNITSLELQVKSLLPDYTLAALQDPESAQTKALQWILDDPLLESYVNVEWRLQQRLALASLYYANEGSEWEIQDYWLSYQHHECSWWSRDWFAPPSPGMVFISVEHPNPCELENATALFDENDADEAAYRHLWLIKNNLQGYIPEEIFMLTSLRSLSLSLNAFEGTMSTRFGYLQDLEAVTLSRNPIGLTGTLPTELGLLQNLDFLSLMGNQLTGDISIVGKFPKLYTLMLDWNQFTGSIPKELFSATPLFVAYLDNNFLTGSLPTEIGRLGAMVDFYVDHNQLSGTIPSQVGLMQFVERFGVNNNILTGTVCTELGTLSNLGPLELHSNQLSGPIPSELASLPNVTHILLQDNDFTGTVPLEIIDLLPVLNGTGASSLFALNVTNNPLSEEHSQEELCWANSTFFGSDTCSDLYYRYLTVSCECDCSCA